MKRMLALLLSLCFLLSACATAQPGGGETAGGKQEGTEVKDDTKTPETTPDQGGTPAVPDTQAEKLALRVAALPQIPAAPDEAALWEAMAKLDSSDRQKYQEEQQKLWDAYDAQWSAYREAIFRLRGEGVDAALVPALTAYSAKTAQGLLTDRGVNDGFRKNVVFSPANLYLALCMLCETVDGESRAQLLELLGLADAAQARSAANSLFRALYNESATGKTLLANSIWMNENVTYHQDTIDTLADDYFASTFRGPMGTKEIDAAIAAWINDNTGHLLEDAASALETDPMTVLMLISTLYFKSNWVDEFPKHLTQEDVFTTALGEEQKIDFMHAKRSGSFLVGEGWKMASLGFRDGMSMRILLPDDRGGLDALLSDAEVFRTFLTDGGEKTYGDVIWSVPKFDVQSDLELTPLLKWAGVTDVFDDNRADFSPLTDLALPMAVSQVEHAARIKVDEEGCEAAAFTAIDVKATAAMPMEKPTIEMELDHPFALLITGTDGLPLFMATVYTMK